MDTLQPGFLIIIVYIRPMATEAEAVMKDVAGACLYSFSMSHLANGDCICKSVQCRPWWCSSSKLAVLENLHQHAAA